jgi:1,4-alpha-glucan branching enzyme
MMERLLHDGVTFRPTMTMSPPLCEMLVDPLLRDRYRRHAGELLETVRRERGRVDARFGKALDLYERSLAESLDYVGRNDLLAVFRRIQETGLARDRDLRRDARATCRSSSTRSRRSVLRSRTTGSTSAARRAGSGCPSAPSRRASTASSRRTASSSSSWTPTGSVNGSRIPKFGVHAPIRTPAGCAVFARDTETSKQVWSSKEGYPGDIAYREFYRDMGYDLGLGGISASSTTGSRGTCSSTRSSRTIPTSRWAGRGSMRGTSWSTARCRRAI